MIILLKHLRYCWFILIIQFSLTDSSGQRFTRIDSLYHELIVNFDEVPKDSNSVKKYYEYAILCSENKGAWNTMKEPQVCYFGLRMSIDIGYQKGIDDFLQVLKKCFRQKEGIPFINKYAYPDRIAKNKVKLLHQARKHLHGGTVDWYIKAYSEYISLKMYREAGIVKFWNGLAFYDLECFGEAMKLFNASEKFFYLLNDISYIKKIKLYKGCTYYYQNEFVSAISEFDRAAFYCRRDFDSSALAVSLYNRGEVFLAMGQPQKALQDFRLAYNIEQSQSDSGIQRLGEIKIARACIALQMYGNCLAILNKAYNKAVSNHDKSSETEILYLLFQANRQAGNMALAASYLEAYANLRDSLFVEEIDVFSENRENFWINKLGRQLTYQAHIDHQRDSMFVQLKKNKLLLWGILGITFLLLLIGIILYRSNKNNKKANQYLTELDKTRNLFFSIIAHDLRGPMLATELFLKPAIINAERYGEEDLINSLKEMNVQNNSQKLLLDNLLFWAGLQRGTLTCQLQKVSISDVFTNSVNLFLPYAKQKGCNIFIDKIGSEFIWADQNMMFLILRNLIDNALKHAGSSIEIVLSTIIENDFLRVQISDNGNGINPLIVDQFMKAKSNGIDENSNKLGLSLVKDFVKMQGGNIKIERLSLGTCISFTIPLYKEKYEANEH